MDSFRRLRPYYFPFFILLLFSSCLRKPPTVSRAYYYWRMGDASYDERRFLKQHDIRKLYTRLMDVDWSETQGAIPVASSEIEALKHALQVYDSFPVQIVPVVFITNKTFERIDSFEIPLLAKRLVRRCLPSYDEADIEYEKSYYIQSNGGPVRPREIQFDCDWTIKTAPKYFRFLEEVKKLLPSDSIQISATVRLHQYKYPSRTGVPPVNRGMLMVYNIADPKQYSGESSIFDYNRAKTYFTSYKKYPLPLDIVLPAWSWCLIYRNQKFYQIENGMDEGDLKTLSFVKAKGNHFYSVTTDTVYRDLFLRVGDEIKAEGIDEKTLQQAASLAAKAVNTSQYTVTLFELSEKEIKHYSHETVDKIYTSFR
jgi:hypothetical protein